MWKGVFTVAHALTSTYLLSTNTYHCALMAYCLLEHTQPKRRLDRVHPTRSPNPAHLLCGWTSGAKGVDFIQS